MSLLNQQRLIIFVIGAATIAAGVFSWHAGQIGSTAAADDRQSVSQTTRQQEQEIEVSLGLIGDIGAYIDYAADYEEALALDDTGTEVDAQGQPTLAETFSGDATNLRLSASARGAAAGLFGMQSLYRDLDSPSTEPQPFDAEVQMERLRAEVSTGPTAPGALDPDHWADEADSIRSRMKGIRVGVLVIILSLVLLTVAQFTKKFPVRITAGIAGLIIFGAAATFTAVNYW